MTVVEPVVARDGVRCQGGLKISGAGKGPLPVWVAIVGGDFGVILNPLHTVGFKKYSKQKTFFLCLQASAFLYLFILLNKHQRYKIRQYLLQLSACVHVSRR